MNCRVVDVWALAFMEMVLKVPQDGEQFPGAISLTSCIRGLSFYIVGP